MFFREITNGLIDHALEEKSLKNSLSSIINTNDILYTHEYVARKCISFSRYVVVSNAKKLHAISS